MKDDQVPKVNVKAFTTEMQWLPMSKETILTPIK